MNRHHAVAPTTRTLELDQIRELNRRLDEPHDIRTVTAQALGIRPDQLVAEQQWPSIIDTQWTAPKPPPRSGRIVVEHVWAEGSPWCPYIWARLRVLGSGGDQGEELVAMLDVDVLDRLSRSLGLRQRWATA